jgi:hypothetical protein
LCPESLLEREGSAMLGSPKGRLDQPRTELPRAAGGSINGMRVVMGILLVLIALAVITGVAVAMTSGQPTVAFVIGLVGLAFFSRAFC